MVAVDILTGYLGAGKTTLLRHALVRGFAGRRVAIVVNELGAVGIDGTVLAGAGGVHDLVELADGCVCCTIDQQRMERALLELVDRRGAELVIMETTGVADPAPLAARLRGFGFGIDAITAVVDATAFERTVRRAPVAARQVGGADFVVIAKTDLVTDRERRRVEGLVARRNPRAERFTAVRGRLDPSLLFATGVALWRTRASEPGVAGSEGIESFVFRSPGAMHLERLEAALAALPRAIVRAKGVFRVAGAGGPCVFNYASGRTELSWVGGPPVQDNQAVFIGRGARRYAVRIHDALRACAAPVGPAGERRAALCAT